MRVIWICHFSNKEIQSLLHPGYSFNEYAPWITQLAKLFENDDRLELHIVSPHNKIFGIRNIFRKGIHYHFFNPRIHFFRWSMPDLFNLDLRTNFLRNRRIIGKIVRRIKPDIIHLHGAENAYYSSSVFQFKGRFPVLITVQGFIFPTTEKINSYVKKRIGVEKMIIQEFSHFGVRTKEMGQIILKISPLAKLHWHNYPVKPIEPILTKKKFDLVFFGRVSKDKGIDDLLAAVSILKKNFPSIKLCVIGHASEIYKKKAIDLNINVNVFWSGFIKTQDEAHKLVSEAYISVLPTYHDIIPGTIIECMFLKIPIIAYSVGGLPDINDDEEYIALVPKGNITELVEKINWFLKNKHLLETIAEKAQKRAKKMFDNDIIPDQIFNAYSQIINSSSF